MIDTAGPGSGRQVGSQSDLNIWVSFGDPAAIDLYADFNWAEYGHKS